MRERTHYCDIHDRFVYAPDVAIEMSYIFLGTHQWKCEARLVGIGSDVVFYTETAQYTDMGEMMRQNRQAVDDVLMRLALLVSVKTQREEMR